VGSSDVNKDSNKNKHNKGFYDEDYDDDYDYDDYNDHVYGNQKDFAPVANKKDSSSGHNNANAWNNFSPNQWEVVTSKNYYKRN